jgi:hypothetical protein
MQYWVKLNSRSRKRNKLLEVALMKDIIFLLTAISDLIGKDCKRAMRKLIKLEHKSDKIDLKILVGGHFLYD